MRGMVQMGRGALALPLFALLFSGCLGGDDLSLDDAGAPLVFDEAPLTFTGAVARAQDVDHPIQVTEDTAYLDLQVTFSGNDLPYSTPGFAVLDPAGDQVPLGPFAAGGEHVVPRLLLEKHGMGPYTLRVSGSERATAEVGYEIQGVIATGTIPAAASMAPLADAPVAADGSPDRPADAAGADDARVVVAVVDTGINVYHEAFRADGHVPVPDAVDASDEAPAPVPLQVPLTLEGNERVADGAIRDDAQWRATAPKTLYRFEGTRVLGISFIKEAAYPVLDFAGHGTATSATVLKAHPEADLVMVQTTGGTLGEAIRWAAAQPWIDVISVSWGAAGNLPFEVVFGHDVAAAAKAAQESGKVFVKSAGNDPSLNYGDSDGPPWVIAVSGAEPTSRSRDAVPSNGGMDFVSDFSVDVATFRSINGTGWTQGTSFAAPHTAGSFARAIHLVREEAGHTGGIRDGMLVDAGGIQLDWDGIVAAMARAAVYWDTAEYDPTSPPGDDPVTQVLGTGTPFLPGAPWVTAGWGYVDGAAGEAAAHHILGHASLPEKPPEAQAYMALQQQVRGAIWGV